MDALLKLELWRQLLIFVPLQLVLLIAAITDIRERKVYNKLTYPAFFVGLIAHGIAVGLDGFLVALATATVTFLIGLFLLPMGILKGGDIKLFIVVAAFLGYAPLPEIFFYSILAGGVIGITMSIFNGYLLTLFKRIWTLLKGYFLMLAYQTKNLAPKLEPDERSKMPFATAILAGSILTFTEHLYAWPGIFTAYIKMLGY